MRHQETHSPDPVQLPVTSQVIGNTPLTGIAACVSSPAEKDHTIDLTLNIVQPFQPFLCTNLRFPVAVNKTIGNLTEINITVLEQY